MKRLSALSLAGYVVFCLPHQLVAKALPTVSVKDQLTEMLDDQVALLDTAIGFAKKSHEKFNHEDEDYMAAKSQSASNKLMKAEHDLNVEVKKIVDPSNVRAINELLPLKKELIELDFYKQLPQDQAPKSKKRELREKNNARIDRYSSGIGMIDSKIDRLNSDIRKIQVIQNQNDLSDEQDAAFDTLLAVKRKFKAELKKHKQDMQKAIGQLKKHARNLE